MSACRTLPSPDICPTQDDVREQLLAILPRGRAWATPSGSVRWKFFHALAAPIQFANARICALLDEFFCATHSETDDVWMATYGLPDGCDPFPDLCTKVSALGGARCDYWTGVAASAGWSVTCVDIDDAVGFIASCAVASCDMPGVSLGGAQLVLRVSLSGSPAYGGAGQTQALASLMLASDALSCAPDISPLQCLMARILPAHVQVSYEVTA